MLDAFNSIALTPLCWGDTHYLPGSILSLRTESKIERGKNREGEKGREGERERTSSLVIVEKYLGS